jgi:hypothetical protein
LGGGLTFLGVKAFGLAFDLIPGLAFAVFNLFGGLEFSAETFLFLLITETRLKTASKEKISRFFYPPKMRTSSP